MHRVRTLARRRLGGRPLAGAPSPIQTSDDPEVLLPGLYERTITLGCSRWRWGHLYNVIVDGGHAHNVCVSDTVLALRLVRPGGVIVWDDYTPYWPGVKETLDALVRMVPLTHYPRIGLVVYADRRPGTASADPAAAALALRSHAAPSAEGRIRGG
jgi:hypothetical protein